jgi:hypothetical protein
MSTVNLAALLLLGLLLVMPQQSMQASLIDPIAEIERSNCKIAHLRLGLVFTSDNNERALQDSGLYSPDSEDSSVDIAGRRFHSGTLNGSSIVYVKTGSPSVRLTLPLFIFNERNLHLSCFKYFFMTGKYGNNFANPFS